MSIKVRPSQQRLGELPGMTRQTAMQQVHDLEAHSLLAWPCGRAVVRDMAGLQALGSKQTPMPYR